MRIRKRWPAATPPAPPPESLLVSPAPLDPTVSGIFRPPPPPGSSVQQPSLLDQTCLSSSFTHHVYASSSSSTQEILHPYPCNCCDPVLDPQVHNRRPSDLSLAGANRSSSDENGKITTMAHDCMMKRPSSTHHHLAFKDPEVGVGGEGESEAEDKRLVTNNRGKEETNISAGAKACGDGGILVNSSSSSSLSHQGGRWCKGEMTFPLNKRSSRALILEDNDNEEEDDDDEKKMKMMKKTRSSRCKNKKLCDDDDQKLQEEDENGWDDETINKKKKKKKSRRGGIGGGSGAILEGSRCSRVNGRGWRCCQQTLVGYSLCEHHLGKGRLRSMSSVRSRTTTVITTNPTKKEKELKLEDDQEEEEEEGILLLSYFSSKNNNKLKEEEDQKALLNKMTKNKKRRIGIVKARSISSLLGDDTRDLHAARRMVSDNNHLLPPPPQPPCYDNNNNDNHNLMGVDQS